MILLVVKDKNILETWAFYFEGPHKHNNISMTFCVGTLSSCCIPHLCMKNITLQLCSFSLEDDITTLSHQEP